MPQYTAIVRSLPPEKFLEIFSASARRAREVYFQRHGIRKPRSLSGLPKAGGTTEMRARLLHDALRAKEDEEMVEEVLRTWLLSKRGMLSAALDHLGIPHTEGLTDSEDLKKFESLGRSDLQALAAKLEPTASRMDIAIYLKFMGSGGVDEALADEPAAATPGEPKDDAALAP